MGNRHKGVPGTKKDVKTIRKTISHLHTRVKSWGWSRVWHIGLFYILSDVYVRNYFIIFVEHVELGLRPSHSLFSVHLGAAVYKETELSVLGGAFAHYILILVTIIIIFIQLVIA